MPYLVSPEQLSLKKHPEISEKMIQEKIAEDPTILGLGDLILKDKERMQPRAGRLDLLFQDPDINRRYEVEIQLGKADESHIIRTIEYWDIERKRYPQYDHCAVIIAEDITSRFLNVISLFNGFIPLIAIQMNAYKFGEDIALVFTKVLDELPLGLEEDEEQEIARSITDRVYWEKRSSSETMQLADRYLSVINELGRSYSYRYIRTSIRFEENGQHLSFIWIKPWKKYFTLIMRIAKSDEIDNFLQNANLDVLEYYKNRYRIRVDHETLNDSKEQLKGLFLLVEEKFNE
ncbi:MAG: hypothetical protein KDC56_08190 [Flavobacteriaceae bacterium]|nr:hypothetical protein [Flavobacteriaceae bacterium]